MNNTLKAGELRELSTQELLQREKESAMELFNLRFQMATGQLSNHTAIRKIKKDIARIKTALNEKDNKKDNAGS
ncbi:MAG: 50S ribosomal protein L29 [Deltaproteobacteria bacterium]|nr:50S ribosomal protein L29 [Deltaproteobacteria bacterium]MBW2334829.1 50S ribosomal protein L29 [Deltaproteobacteria bacterium]